MSGVQDVEDAIGEDDGFASLTLASSCASKRESASSDSSLGGGKYAPVNNGRGRAGSPAAAVPDMHHGSAASGYGDTGGIDADTRRLFFDAGARAERERHCRSEEMTRADIVGALHWMGRQMTVRCCRSIRNTPSAAISNRGVLGIDKREQLPPDALDLRKIVPRLANRCARRALIVTGAAPQDDWADHCRSNVPEAIQVL